MLSPQDLRGIYVPVVTPFSHEYAMDVPSYHRYLENLLSHDIQGLIINGTTGEAPTVTWEEVVQVVEETRKGLDGRQLPVIIGTGTNDTFSSMKRTEWAGHIGADAVLVSRRITAALRLRAYNMKARMRPSASSRTSRSSEWKRTA